MIDVKSLTKSQRMALETMKHFNCKGISCEDCPLCCEQGCGATIASHIIELYKEEFKQ